MPFDGTTYIRELDGKRLGAQLALVLNLMRDGCWRTLGEIADRTGGLPEASISARLRDIRKAKFAKHFTMDSRRRKTVVTAMMGLWEYRVRPIETQPRLPYEVARMRGIPYRRNASF